MDFDRPIRLYNVKTLLRTRMHNFTKQCIDTTMINCLLNSSTVSVVKLSDQDIKEFKKNYSMKKFDEYLSQEYGYEPFQKKISLQNGNEEKFPQRLKLVLFREGETDKFTSQFKTVSNEKDNSSSSSSISAVDVSENEHSKESSIGKQLFISKLKVVTSEKLYENKETFEKYYQTFGPSGENILDDKKKSASRSKHVPGARVEPGNVEPGNIEPGNVEPGNVEPRNGEPSNVEPRNNNSSPTRVKIPLKEVERLHLKYFTKPIQDTIVIIANILNMISLSNRHHKLRMDESFKKKTEAEKLKERCDANRMHLRHKKVLESKLKTNFLVVISMFAENEFVPAFQMFFLSILTVLRVLDQPKFKKGSIFKNLVLLLWTSLKNSDFDNAKVFGMFRSKEFRPDCIELITLIEESRNGDPDIAQRMAIYFVSSVNSREHFQPVINVLTSDSNEDLSLLIDNASYKSRVCSQFGHREDRQELANRTPPVAASVHNSIHVDSVQKWLLSRAPTIPSQGVLPVKRTNSSNDGNPQKALLISNPSMMNKSRVFYESFSNSLNQTNSSELGTGALPQKVTVVTSAALTSVGQPKTLVIKPAGPNFKPVPTSSIQGTDFSSIFVGKNKYHLVKGPSGEMKAVAASSVSTVTTTNAVTTNVLIRPAFTQRPHIDVAVKCFLKGCKNPAAIMCSKCQSVKYCSNNCQTKDWYDSHIHNCARLQSVRPTQRGKI